MPYPVSAVRGNVAKGCYPSGAKYTISGNVYDSDGTTAVLGATVALGAYTGLSGAGGAYTIAGIPRGTSGNMTCSIAGYSYTAITVAAMTGNLTSQNYTNAWWAAAGISGSCVAAWKPKGAASYAASKTDVATATYTASDGVAFPSWDATNGWKFDKASSQYLTTALVPTGNQTWSMVVVFTNGDAASANETLCGAETGNYAFQLWSCLSTNKHVYFSGNKFVSTATSLAAGRMEMCGKNCYLNGVSDGTIAAYDGTPSQTQGVYFGARNNDGVAEQFATAYIQAVAVYNTDVSAAVAILDAALALV